MADTLPTFTITDEWTSVNELTSLPIGTALVVQNQGATQGLYAASPTKPAAGFMGVIMPPRIDRPLMVDQGESETWIKARFPGTTMRVNIQEG